MTRSLAVLMVAVLAVPAFAEYFGVTGDGSSDVFRDEGYANAGSTGQPRIGKSNEHNGWLSFVGATGDLSGQSINDYVVNQCGGWSNPNLQINLHFCTTAALQTGTGTGAAIESLRCGNSGAVVEDAGPLSTGDYVGPAGPSAGGQTEPVAWRMGPSPWTFKGEYGQGNGGAAWKTPAGRTTDTIYAFADSGGTPDTVAIAKGAGAELRYSGGGVPSPTGNRGYYGNSQAWAIQDLLGGWRYRGALNLTSATYNARKSGQIFVGDAGGTSVTRINETDYPASALNDPRLKGGHTNGASNFWYSVLLDLAFAQDQATNTECKGLVFQNKIEGITGWAGNTTFWSKDQSDAFGMGTYAAYLEITPEPATLALLALGGLLAVRSRRS